MPDQQTGPARSDLVIVADADASIPRRMRDDLSILTAPLDAPLLEGPVNLAELHVEAERRDPDAVASALRRAATHGGTVLYFSVAAGAGERPASDAVERARTAIGEDARLIHHATGASLMAAGWQAVAAAMAARDRGGGAEQREAALDAARGVAGRVELLAALEHPQLLNVAGPLAGLQRRRALVSLRGGSVELLGRVTRREQALIDLRDRFTERASVGDGYLRVAVHHAGAEAAAEAMARWVAQTVAPEELVVAPLTRHAAARFGPGTVAFAWYREL